MNFIVNFVDYKKEYKKKITENLQNVILELEKDDMQIKI